MDQLCSAAEVSKRTAYQHFTSKDELVAEYLRRFDPTVLSDVFDRTDLTPRERLLAAFDIPPPPPPVPLHRRRRRTPRPPAPRVPVRTRLQESRGRATRRHRPRSRRRRP
ncbi:TetR/AcrR family transcriptional regulator [Streptomyces sp. NPDC001811]